MTDYEIAKLNLKSQCESEKEELAIIAKLLSIHVMADNMEDAYDVLGEERMKQIRDETEYFAKNDCEVFEYINYVMDEIE